MFPVALKAGRKGGPDSDVNLLIGSRVAYVLTKPVCRCGKLQMPDLADSAGSIVHKL
jgi:hypothetical protein